MVMLSHNALSSYIFNAYAQQQGEGPATGVTTLVDKGNALLNQGNFTQAIQYFDKDLAIDPNYKEALDNRQATLSKMGNVSSSANVGGS